MPLNPLPKRMMPTVAFHTFSSQPAHLLLGGSSFFLARLWHFLKAWPTLILMVQPGWVVTLAVGKAELRTTDTASEGSVPVASRCAIGSDSGPCLCLGLGAKCGWNGIF